MRCQHCGSEVTTGGCSNPQCPGVGLVHDGGAGVVMGSAHTEQTEQDIFLGWLLREGVKFKASPSICDPYHDTVIYLEKSSHLGSNVEIVFSNGRFKSLEAVG